MTRYTLRLNGRDYGCFDSATAATLAGIEWFPRRQRPIWVDSSWTRPAIVGREEPAREARRTGWSLFQENRMAKPSTLTLALARINQQIDDLNRAKAILEASATAAPEKPRRVRKKSDTPKIPLAEAKF